MILLLVAGLAIALKLGISFSVEENLALGGVVMIVIVLAKNEDPDPDCFSKPKQE